MELFLWLLQLLTRSADRTKVAFHWWDIFDPARLNKGDAARPAQLITRQIEIIWLHTYVLTTGNFYKKTLN